MLRCVSQRNRLRGFTGLNSTCSDINIAVGGSKAWRKFVSRLQVYTVSTDI